MTDFPETPESTFKIGDWAILVNENSARLFRAGGISWLPVSTSERFHERVHEHHIQMGSKVSDFDKQGVHSFNVPASSLIRCPDLKTATLWLEIMNAVVEVGAKRLEKMLSDNIKEFRSIENLIRLMSEKSFAED